MRCSVPGWPGGPRSWCRRRWRPAGRAGLLASGRDHLRPPAGPGRFRRLVLDAAGTAAETSLAGLPAGQVTSRADALRVVEAIELLLDVSQWEPADDMYANRSGHPEVWMTLPAARLGQRAATAFVATPARRDACATQLSSNRLSFYLNSVGLWAMYAGDLVRHRNTCPWACASTVTPTTC